ncbi:MAG: hypothetical protein Q8R72_14305 [Hylemonella sp.]|nr:hypothetical protein [Hylemonella sp.]
MKNESAHLQATQDLHAGADETPALAEPTIVSLPLYRAGTRVSYQDRDYTVGHVVISRGDLQVYLQELGSSVSSEKLHLAPTRLVLQRS